MQIKDNSTVQLLQMLVKQIEIMDEADLNQLWVERFPNAEKREYYEELGRMFPDFRSRMMGMDIHGLLQTTYECGVVGEDTFHTFLLVKNGKPLANIMDSSLDSAWKRLYLIATQYDSMG